MAGPPGEASPRVVRLASAGLPAWATPSGPSAESSRVLRVHSPRATREWDYATNAPCDHTVEMTAEQPGRIEERYFDFIDGDVVERMLDLGVRQLTGAPRPPGPGGSCCPASRPSRRSP